MIVMTAQDIHMLITSYVQDRRAWERAKRRVNDTKAKLGTTTQLESLADLRMAAAVLGTESTAPVPEEAAADYARAVRVLETAQSAHVSAVAEEERAAKAAKAALRLLVDCLPPLPA